MTSMKKNLLSAAACALMGLASSAQAGVIIDLFTDGNQLVEVSSVGAMASDQTANFPATIIGGYRDIWVQQTGSSLNKGKSTLEVSAGTLVFSNDTGVSGTGVITWDGAVKAVDVDGNVKPTINGLAGKDITSAGSADRFLVDVFSADLGFDYMITLWDMDGDRSTLSAGAQFAVNPLSPITADYLFSWFNLANGSYCNGFAYVPGTCSNPLTQLEFTIDRIGGPIDFTRIGAIQLTLFGVSNSDFAIGSIRTVPEPATLGLVGLALLGAGALSRRQARKG